MNDIIARLEALAAESKPWLATIYRDNGTTRTLRQPRKAMAQAHCERLASMPGFIRATVTYQPE